MSWTGDYDRHAMARLGIGTGTKKYGMVIRAKKPVWYQFPTLKARKEVIVEMKKNPKTRDLEYATFEIPNGDLR